MTGLEAGILILTCSRGMLIGFLLGGVVVSSSIKTAGDTFDDAIIKYIKKEGEKMRKSRETYGKNKISRSPPGQNQI